MNLFITVVHIVQSYYFICCQDYLESLHELHEDWLVRRTRFSCPASVLVSCVMHIHSLIYTASVHDYSLVLPCVGKPVC